MTYKCPKCGADIPEIAKFCPECGTAQKTGKKSKSRSQAKKPAEQHPSKIQGYNLIYLVALVSIIVVGLYGYRFLIPKENANSPGGPENVIRPERQPVVDQKLFDQLKSRVETNPDGFSENVDLGNFLFDNQRFDQAVKYYDRALEINPANTDVLVDAGVCYFNLQNYARARDFFEKALAIDDRHVNALYNLGVVSTQLGDMKVMLDSWEKLIAVAPQSSQAQAAKQMIDQIKNSNSANQ